MPILAARSRLLAPSARVFAHATSMAGINRELAPLLRMTHPAGMDSLGGRQPPLGAPLFRSWILLFGVIPVDFDDVTFESIEPGKGFRERSRVWGQEQWIHERSIEAADGGCRLEDRITFEPRLPLFGIYARALRLAFANRHRQFVRMFGGEVESVGVG